MKSAQEYVTAMVKLIEAAREMPLGQEPLPKESPPPPGTPKLLLFSPHPDDEAVVGGLALRLQHQAGWEVVNVAVTQGSNPARQSARWKELQDCCRYLGFRLLQTWPGGLPSVNPGTRTKDPKGWHASVDRLAEILQAERPQAICFPHERDWNSTHIGTHYLVLDALGQLPLTFGCYTIETEFWGAMDSPNLMVESSPAEVSALIAGLTFHVGEVRRNPYHLRLPAWMMDNVRRGGELVGGQGGAPPEFLFATLYRVRRWESGRLNEVWGAGRFLGQKEPPQSLFSPEN